MVLTTYEGQHDHALPPTRTVTHNTTGVNVHSAAHSDESRTKVEESETVCLEMVVYSGSVAENKSSEQLSGDLRTKSDFSGTVSASLIDAPISGPASGSNEQQIGKLDPSEESDAVDCGTIVHSKSNSQNTSKEQLSSKLETKSEKDTVCIDKMVHITPRSECAFNEQRLPSAEPIQS